jgi:hypothetical protein
MSVTKVTGMMQTSTKGGDIPSASPTVIDTDGDYFDVTGTTNFAAFTVVAGRRFTVQFDGALTMTHHATTLDLPGAANITTVAGDVAEFFATGTNTVQCVNYTKADGTAVVLADNAITLAKMAGGTDGNIISYDASGDPVAIATGNDGQVLTSAGAGAPPVFEDAAGGGEDGLTNNSNTTWMVVSSDEEVTMPLQPCFSAVSTTTVSNVTGDNTVYTQIYNTERFDQNADFDGTSTFTAPVTGKYLLSARSGSFAGLSSHSNFSFDINTSNERFKGTNDNPSTANANINAYAICVVIADMDAADTATCESTVGGGAAGKVVDIYGDGLNAYTYFTGCLLA